MNINYELWCWRYYMNLCLFKREWLEKYGEDI